jgi:hypothetical protein
MLATDKVIGIITDIIDSQNSFHIEAVKIMLEIIKELPSNRHIEMMTELEKAFGLVKADIDRVVELRKIIMEASK